MFQTVSILLDWFGLGIFAITSALVASRKEMDITGFALLGSVTGVGGGTIRDLVLGRTRSSGCRSRPMCSSASASQC